ncbi:MAG: hypothetical protein ACM3UZ_13030 [Acidobacteriota bacterium]
MNKAVILHSVWDAEHCINHDLHKSYNLYSTHSSVDVYLHEKYGVDCTCLSYLLANDDLLEFRNTITKLVDNTLEELDSKIAPEINERFDLNMRYFKPVYSYYGKQQMMVYFCLVNAINRLIKNTNVTELLIYQTELNHFVISRTNIQDIKELFFPDVELGILDNGQHQQTSFFDKLMKYRNPLKLAKKVFQIVEPMIKYHKLSGNKKTILITELLYDLQFLPAELKAYNLLYYKFNHPFPFSAPVDSSKIDLDKIMLKISEFSTKDPYTRLFINDIYYGFYRFAPESIKGLIYLKEYHKNNKISVGIWGLPPVDPVRALLYELLRSENITVIGAQHGSCYVDSIFPWHFDSDFNNCDYYLSYGFDELDLARAYPGSECRAKILPYGKVKLAVEKMGPIKPPIKILFPLTTTTSMLGGGITRLLPHEITERQIAILEFLNSIQGIQAYVKPVPGSTIENCAILPLLNKYPNLVLVNDATLLEFLNKTNPQVIVFEFPSTPLMEVLPLNAEIFCMNDPVNPYEHHALKMLRGRVHYAEDVSELINQLDRFLKGEIEGKRDIDFLNHYVYKKNSRENIVDFIVNAVESTQQH